MDRLFYQLNGQKITKKLLSVDELYILPKSYLWDEIRSKTVTLNIIKYSVRSEGRRSLEINDLAIDHLSFYLSQVKVIYRERFKEGYKVLTASALRKLRKEEMKKTLKVLGIMKPTT